MVCSNCGHIKTERNEIDDTLCCINCGKVLDNIIFSDHQTEADYRSTTYFKSKKEKAPTKQCINRFLIELHKLGYFFQLPSYLITRGENIIKDHAYDFNNRHPNEVAICIIYIITRETKPDWSIYDYIETCPIYIDFKYVAITYSTIAHFYPDMPLLTPMNSQDQISNYLIRIYPSVKQQVYLGDKKHKKHKGFSYKELKKRTQDLIQLADMYCLNSGKKRRPAIIVAALLSGLSLRIERLKTGSKVERKISCFRHFDFHSLQKISFAHFRTMRIHFSEYIDFLSACARNIPWIKHLYRNYVHYYITDILDMYGKKNGKEPTLTLSQDQFSVSSFRRSTEKREKMNSIIKEAKKNIEEGIVPEEKISIEFTVYKLLLYGYRTEDIFQWSESYMRNLAHCIWLKEETGIGIVSRMDLDRIEVDEEDMSEREIEAYLR